MISKNHKILVIAIFCFALISFFIKEFAISSFAPEPINSAKNNSNLETVEASLIDSQGNTHDFTLELARTDKDKELGLMYRESLPDNHGMLFLYDEDVRNGFWMKNTLIPLDIYFLDENYQVVDKFLNVQPCKAEKCDLYRPSVLYRYVLEISPSDREYVEIFL